MPSTPPDGDPAPHDGSLPAAALAGLGERPFGVYVHVPFCATRCGYCDFNTYTAIELGGGASQAAYADRRSPSSTWPGASSAPTDLPVETVFFGGGTPTLLPPGRPRAMLAAVRDAFGLAAGAEVTTEANPDSVDPQALGRLASRGLHPRLVRHAVGRAARARGPGPHA